MIAITDLPHVLAAINLMTSLVLIAGFVFIRGGNIPAHRISMRIALLLGALFLVIYIYYHSNSGLAKFGGFGTVRTVYFSILIAHVLMALAASLLVPITALRGIKDQRYKHRRIARWALPVWLFVSITGVIIYVMAVHIYPWTGV